jgi:hypothetical protein
MSTDKFLVLTNSRSTLLQSLGADSVENFCEIMENELKKYGSLILDKENINKAGCTILARLIQSKLEAQIAILEPKTEGKKRSLQVLTNQNKEEDLEKANDIRQRLVYFKSSEFQEIFLNDLPSRITLDQGSTDLGYSKYLKTLFSATISKDIRKLIDPLSASSQCDAILEPSSKNGVCYLCDKTMFPSQHIECEHILPIMSALSHMWLYNGSHKTMSSQEKNEMFKKEYAWSHECCNQTKSSLEFIVYDFSSKQYIINVKAIQDFYNELNKNIKNGTHNCNEINDGNKPSPTHTLSVYLKQILEIININLSNICQHSEADVKYYYYMVLCKFKIFSAFSDIDFLKKVLFDENTEIPEYLELKKQQKTRIITKKELYLLSSELKKKNIEKNQLLTVIRAVSVNGELSRQNRKNQTLEELLESRDKLDAKIKDITKKLDEKKEEFNKAMDNEKIALIEYEKAKQLILSTSDEIEGGGSLKRTMSLPITKKDKIKLQKKVYIRNILYYILTNPDYNPTQKEIKEAIKNITNLTQQSITMKTAKSEKKTTSLTRTNRPSRQSKPSRPSRPSIRSRQSISSRLSRRK